MENKITINSKEYSFSQDETILDVANRNNIHIPTLCYLKDATPTGACRICVVENMKTGKIMPSCATPAENGMTVETDSRNVFESRQQTIAFLMASGNHNCQISSKDVLR